MVGGHRNEVSHFKQVILSSDVCPPSLVFERFTTYIVLTVTRSVYLKSIRQIVDHIPGNFLRVFNI